MININPEEFYSRLYENASTRKRRTLEIIHEVCKKQVQQGSKDFSITTIVNLLVDKNGPSEQTLRNKTGEDYRRLISLWAEYSNGSNKKIKKQNSSTFNDEILESVNDPTIRALVGIILSENKKLKSENSLLKHQTTLTIDMRKSKDESHGVGQNNDLVTNSYNLTDTELKALNEAISDEFIQHRGWIVDDYGRVKEKGVQVYRPGYVTAIKKILNKNSNDGK